jgi:hypothetical protein
VALKAEPHKPSQELKSVTIVSMSATRLFFGLLELSALPLVLFLLD